VIVTVATDWSVAEHAVRIKSPTNSRFWVLCIGNIGNPSSINTQEWLLRFCHSDRRKQISLERCVHIIIFNQISGTLTR